MVTGVNIRVILRCQEECRLIRNMQSRQGGMLPSERGLKFDRAILSRGRGISV